MSQVRPVVGAMLVCDLVLSEEGTQQVSLIRVFDTIRVRRFPATRGPLYIYAFLTDAEGRYEIQVELRCLQDLVAIGQRMSLGVAVHDRHAFSEFVFEVEEITFERPGRYAFTLYASDRVLGVRSFSVVQSGEGDRS